MENCQFWLKPFPSVTELVTMINGKNRECPMILNQRLNADIFFFISCNFICTATSTKTSTGGLLKKSSNSC